MTTEQSQETKIAVLEAKVDHLIGHVKELTQRVRANEKVVASVSLLGVIACTIVGAGYFAPKAEAEPRYVDDLENGKIVYVDSRDDNPFVIQETYNHMIHELRNWRAKQDRTPVEDSINNALAELEYNYGSNDPTEQEELLQLSSGVDRQSS